MPVKKLREVLEEAKKSVKQIAKPNNSSDLHGGDIAIPAAELFVGKSVVGADKIRKVPLREIDPSTCVPWKYHNRDVAWFNSSMCADLIKSIEQNGQQEPILVRELENDTDYRYEVIYGMRRWFACSQISNKKLLARVTDLGDKECMILMHSENADSKDITDSERAISFAKQWQSGVFKTQQEFAVALGMSQPNLSKMLKMAEIFAVPWLDELFDNKIGIPLKYAYSVSVMLKQDSVDKLRKQAGIIRDEILEGKKIDNSAILKRLVAGVKNKAAQQKHPTPLLVRDNKVMVAAKQNSRGDISIMLSGQLTAKDLAAVEKACLEEIRSKIIHR